MYLNIIHQPPLRKLFCLDSRYCCKEIPEGVTFYHQDILGNNLPRSFFDAVLLVSTIEHIGLLCYGQKPVVYGDMLAVSEVWFLLKPGGRLVLTVPVGCVRVDSGIVSIVQQRLRVCCMVGDAPLLIGVSMDHSMCLLEKMKW